MLGWNHGSAIGWHSKNYELGYGTCSLDILNQLRGADCRLNLDINNSNMKQLMHENITCSAVDWAVQCAVPLSFKECYTAQELIRSRDLFLEYLYVIIKYHDGNLAKFETCKNEILSKNKAGSIVGINMGLLIVLFLLLLILSSKDLAHVIICKYICTYM